MKKTLILSLLLFVYSALFSQDNLTYGISFIEGPVKLPGMYLDALRARAEGWTTQYMSSKWTNYLNYVSTKDAQGLFTELRYSKWNNNKQQWVTQNLSRYQYTKDRFNRPQSVITDQFNSLLHNDTVTGKSLFFYSLNDLIAVEYQTYSVGTFIPLSTRKLLYNANGLLWQVHVVLTNDSIYEYGQFDYDIKGRCVKYILFAKDNQPWFDTALYSTYEYYPDNTIKKYTAFSKKDGKRPFFPAFEYQYTYNSSGQIERALMSEYNTSTKQLVPARLYGHTYNSLQKLQSLWYKTYNNGLWYHVDSISLNYTVNGMLDTSFSFNGDNKGWRDLSTRYIFGKTTPLGVNKIEPKVSQLIVYPNPSKSKFTVEFEMQYNSSLQLHLTDITGKTLQTIDVFAAAGRNTVELPLQDITPGIYFLTAGNATVKIIKQ